MSALTHLFISTYAISRKTGLVRDGRGGFTSTMEDVGAPIRGRMSGLSAMERTRAAREEAYYTHRFFTEPYADVRRGDLLTDQATDLRYKVVDVVHLSRVDHHFEAICEEMKPGL